MDEIINELELNKVYDAMRIVASSNVGMFIRERRQHLGFSQQKLADEVGVDNSVISKVENNKIKPSLNTFESILEEFDIIR